MYDMTQEEFDMEVEMAFNNLVRMIESGEAKCSYSDVVDVLGSLHVLNVEQGGHELLGFKE